MNETSDSRVHWSFWLIGAFALIWNLAGAVNFALQMNPDMLDMYRESERAIVEGRPAWATAAFAIAVFGGSIGCVLLLFRMSAAFYVLIASLFGVIVTTIHTLRIDFEFGPAEIMGIILMPLVVAAFLVWYSKYAENKGWIRKA